MSTTDPVRTQFLSAEFLEAAVHVREGFPLDGVLRTFDPRIRSAAEAAVIALVTISDELAKAMPSIEEGES